HKDSTANARHGTPVGNTSAVAGMVAGADQFDGNGDAVRLPKTFGLFGGNRSVTVEFWFKADAVAPDTYYGTSPVLFQGRGENAWMLTFGDSMAGNSLSARLNQGGWASPASAPGIVTGRWYYFSTTYATSGANNWKAYLDGALVSQGTLTGTVIADTALNNQYGGSDETGAGVTSRWFKGAMDEVRVSGIARSDNWLWASWNNVFSNETFATYGATQEVGARYAFTVAASGGGNVTGSASGECLPGSTVSITAVPDTYYHWSYWTGNVPSSQTNPLTLTMDQNRSVTAVFEPDLAANGTPVWWLAQYGWTSNFDAAALADSDGDGQTTWQEYLAGTDPTDPASVLRVRIEADPSTGSILLSWSSISGKSYRIEQATDLAGSWTVQTSNVPATPPTNTHEEQLPTGARVFYRVTVE
ncbi:MAG: LamG-like jellyroll fold domain-containing protein, partial [Verrucomicrobiota bacterium]